MIADVATLLTVQITATFMAGFVQVGVKQAMFDHIADICQPGQKSSLTCPHNQVYYSASIVWYVSPSIHPLLSSLSPVSEQLN